MFYLNQLKKFVKKKTMPAVNAGVKKLVCAERQFLGTGFHGHGDPNT
jgi:hypothetical protein